MVRPATIFDLPFALRCWAASWCQRPVAGLELKGELARQAQLFCRVVSGEQLGVALVAPGERGFTLWAGQPPLLTDAGLYVVPEARRQGVARELLRAVREQAKSLGFERIAVAPHTGNGPSRALFESEGWRAEQILYLREV